MDTILLYVVAALGVSTVLNIILKRFGISQIIGYILTGTAIAYTFDIGQGDSHSVELLGEFGIVFLMFTIGLEFSVKHLKRMIFHSNVMLMLGRKLQLSITLSIHLMLKCAI